MSGQIGTIDLRGDPGAFEHYTGCVVEHTFRVEVRPNFGPSSCTHLANSRKFGWIRPEFGRTHKSGQIRAMLAEVKPNSAYSPKSGRTRANNMAEIACIWPNRPKLPRISHKLWPSSAGPALHLAELGTLSAGIAHNFGQTLAVFGPTSDEIAEDLSKSGHLLPKQVQDEFARVMATRGTNDVTRSRAAPGARATPAPGAPRRWPRSPRRNWRQDGEPMTLSRVRNQCAARVGCVLGVCSELRSEAARGRPEVRSGSPSDFKLELGRSKHGS